MERMFIDPETGEIHPESYYIRKNVKITTVIEAVKVNDRIEFVIIPEDVVLMKVRNQAVFEMFRDFVMDITRRFAETEDDEEREGLREVGSMISVAMMRNIEEMQKEWRGGASLH